jgi:hypothetical protein
MGASSVTGISGPGDSHGQQKPKNHCGCGCCNNFTEEEHQAIMKRGCVVNTKASGPARYRSGGGVTVKVC